MIYDSFANAGRYRTLHPLFAECFAFLSERDFAGLSDGNHEIGHGAVARVSTYGTKAAESGIIECHRRFIDIQYVADGEERVGIVPRQSCKGSTFDTSRDFEQLDGTVDFLTLKPGLFAVFFPEDGHMPGISVGQSAVRVKKIVVKVPVVEDH